MPDVVAHGGTHRPEWVGGSDPATPVGFYALKVTADANALDGLLPDTATVPTVGDGKFVIEIDEDLDGARLVRASAYLTTAGGVTIQIRNVRTGADMLSTKITVDAGEKSSYDAAVQPVINPANAEVQGGDQIAVDIDAVSGGKGLGVRLVFAGV